MSERVIDLIDAHEVGLAIARKQAVAEKLSELLSVIDFSWSASGVELWINRELAKLENEQEPLQ